MGFHSLLDISLSLFTVILLRINSLFLERNSNLYDDMFLISRRRFGAYSSRQVYTPQDVASLLEYARLRGVRIIMELDAPSHSGNGWQWGEAAGLGQLAVCVNQQPWRKYCIQPPCGQLNPTNPNLYRVLRDLYRDILDIFPQGEPLHMGGDEASSSNVLLELRGTTQ
jgi:N-acetyl-beta-hexosaminidase